MTATLDDREIAAIECLFVSENPSLHQHLLTLLEIKQEEIDRLEFKCRRLEERITELMAHLSPIWVEPPPEGWPPEVRSI